MSCPIINGHCVFAAPTTTLSTLNRVWNLPCIRDILHPEFVLNQHTDVCCVLECLEHRPAVGAPVLGGQPARALPTSRLGQLRNETYSSLGTKPSGIAISNREPLFFFFVFLLPTAPIHSGVHQDMPVRSARLCRLFHRVRPGTV